MKFQVGDYIYKKDVNSSVIKSTMYKIENIEKVMKGNLYDEIYYCYESTLDNGENYILAVDYISMKLYIEYAVLANYTDGFGIQK